MDLYNFCYCVLVARAKSLGLRIDERVFNGLDETSCLMTEYREGTVVVDDGISSPCQSIPTPSLILHVILGGLNYSILDVSTTIDSINRAASTLDSDATTIMSILNNILGNDVISCINPVDFAIEDCPTAHHIAYDADVRCPQLSHLWSVVNRKALCGAATWFHGPVSIDDVITCPACVSLV